jgi:hypothetical protein
VHAQGYVRVLAVAAEVPLADQQANDQPALEIRQWWG